MHALTKRRGLVPAGVVDFLRLPGVGPKTAARIWTQLGITSLDGLKSAAEEGRLRELSGMGARSEEKILKALEAGVGDKAGGRGGCSAQGAPCGATRGRRARRASGGDRRLGGGQRPAAPRDRARPRRDRDLDRRAGADRGVLRRATGCAEVVARGDTKATVVGHDGLRFDLRVVPPECYGNVLQHFTGSKDHNIALREDAQRRGLSISEYGVTDVETRRGRHARERGRAVRVPRLRAHPARAARGNARDRGRARAARCRRSSSSATCAARCTATRPGRRTARTRSRRWRSRPRPAGYRFLCITDHSHYLRDGRLEAQWKEIDELNARLEVVPRAARDRGEHPRGRLARRRRRRARRARLGHRVAAHVVRPQPDRADPRRDGQPARRLHRAPHGPPAARSATARRSTSNVSSRTRSRRARRSRSTPSPTGSTCATRTRGWPARRAFGSRSRPTRTRSARSATRSSASPRRGARG